MSTQTYKTNAQVAAEIRAAIKVAQKAGLLPTAKDGIKFSVRKGDYSVNIAMTASTEEGEALLTRPGTEADMRDGWYVPSHVILPQARAWMGQVVKMVDFSNQAEYDHYADYWTPGTHFFFDIAGLNVNAWDCIQDDED